MGINQFETFPIREMIEPQMFYRSFGIVCLTIFFSAAVAVERSWAQQGYPMLMSIDPVAAQIGQDSEHTIESRYTMHGTYRVIVSGSGVTAEVVAPEKQFAEAKSPLQKLAVRFKVASDALPGVREVRLATPQGASTIAPLVIVRDPVMREFGDNNSIENAADFTIPATLCGAIEKAEDVDCYAFNVADGQSLSFHVRCMKLQDVIHDLQSHADPILTIRHSNGSTVAASDNVFGADPFLYHTFDEGGKYFLELRDVRYQGNAHWQYCIEISERPYVRTIFPLAVAAASTPTPVIPRGYGLAATSIATLAPVDAAATGVQMAKLDVSDQDGGETSVHAVQVVVDGGPFEMESELPDGTLDTAQLVALPAGINGVIAEKGEIDLFAFEAKRGEVYTFEVFAKRVGSPLDSHLRILDSSGKQLQINDDLREGKRTYADSKIENWSVPADSRYLIEIRDLNLRGGEDYSYFIKVTSAVPHFRLFADTDKTLLTPGTSGVIFVRAERVNGYDGEIQLSIDGLPPYVSAVAGRILSAPHVDGCIILSADAADTVDMANVEIRGTAKIKEQNGELKDYSSVATIYQEIYQPGGGRGHWPSETHAVSIGTQADIQSVRVSPEDVRIRPGETVTLDVEIGRSPNFDKNVLLELSYTHLSSVFGDPLPKGITIDTAASNTLLTGGATKGKIVLKVAADVTLTDPLPFAVMANVSLNFVMKTTYASKPLTLSIIP